MADITCRVCNEPWDYWGAMHGDMAAWEWDLFRKGAGCPCCKGIAPEGLSDEDALEEHLRSVVFDGVEDPDEFEELHNVNQSSRPAWEEPEPHVLWECGGCGVKVVISNEVPYDGSELSKDDIWLRWYGGRKVHYHGSNYAYSYSNLTNEDPAEFREAPHTIAGKKYCPGCATACAECSQSVFSRSELQGDTYDEGSSFPSPRSPSREVVCVDCLEELEAEADEDETEDEDDEGEEE